MSVRPDESLEDRVLAFQGFQFFCIYRACGCEYVGSLSRRTEDAIDVARCQRSKRHSVFRLAAGSTPLGAPHADVGLAENWKSHHATINGPGFLGILESGCQR